AVTSFGDPRKGRHLQGSAGTAGAQPGRPPGVEGLVQGCAITWEAGIGSRRIAPRMALAGAGDVKRSPHDEAPSSSPIPVPGAGDQPVTATGDPEVALMLRVQAGDQDAFQDLFRRLSPRVLQYARRLVGSEAQAEELTQDVFVQVFRFRHRYRPEARFATWLFTIAT